MDGLLNVDLLSVAVTVSGIGLLGFVIYFNARESITARTFLGFALVTILWSIANYLQYQKTGSDIGLALIRAIVFLGTWHAFLFFQLCLVFPRERFAFPDWYLRGMPLITALVSILTLTPLVFKNAAVTTASGTVVSVTNGPGIAIFSGYVALLIAGGIMLVIRKTWRESGIVRRQLLVVGAGMGFTFSAIVVFNLVLPAFFDNPRFLPLSSVFIFPFIASIAYALYRFELFSVKVVATELFVFLLAVSAAAQVLFSTSIPALIFHSSTFLLTLAFAILLVQNVIKEIKQREKIESQEKALEAANAQQVSLLHFISHEVKGSLNKAQGVFAGLVEGDYGELPDAVKTISRGALGEVAKGITMVMDLLAASDLKKGTMSFDAKEFDCTAAVRQAVDNARLLAKDKGLRVEFVSPPTEAIRFKGDEQKLMRHVFRNLLENAIRYTPSGYVRASLTRAGAIVRFTVEDSGVGITEEDMRKLFTEGGHGKDSIKVNVDSTGFGLFIAKQVVDAHHGKIWAESAGAGKGSRFVVELPTTI